MLCATIATPIMPIHSTYIRYFDEVCHCGSIRKAASKLHVAPSAIGRQILKMEDELGVSLFTRIPSGVQLTPAGEMLSQHISRTLADYKSTIETIESHKQDAEERIAIVAQESVIAQFLPRVFLAFHDQHPKVSTSFTTTSGRALCDLLDNREADVALAFDPEPTAGIEQVTSRPLPVLAVMAPNHPLAKHKQLELRDCAQFPLILPDMTWPLRDILDQLTADLTEQPRVITTSNSVAFLRKMMATDQHIGFQTLVGIEAQIQENKLIQIPLLKRGKPITQDIVLCVRNNEPKSTAFVALLELITSGLETYPSV